MKVLFTYILVFFMMLLSCCTEIGHGEKQEDKSVSLEKWTKGYRKDASFLFVSNYFAEDTMVVVSSSVKDYVSIFDESILARRKPVRYDFMLKREYHKFKGYLKLDFKKDTLQISTSINGFESKSKVVSNNNNYKIGTDFNVFGRSVKDCIIVDSSVGESESMQTGETPKIVKYVFSIKHGLIYYLFDGGEEFYRKDVL